MRGGGRREEDGIQQNFVVVCHPLNIFCSAALTTLSGLLSCYHFRPEARVRNGSCMPHAPL